MNNPFMLAFTTGYDVIRRFGTLRFEIFLCPQGTPG